MSKKVGHICMHILFVLADGLYVLIIYVEVLGKMLHVSLFGAQLLYSNFSNSIKNTNTELKMPSRKYLILYIVGITLSSLLPKVVDAQIEVRLLFIPIHIIIHTMIQFMAMVCWYLHLALLILIKV